MSATAEFFTKVDDTGVIEICCDNETIAQCSDKAGNKCGIMAINHKRG